MKRHSTTVKITREITSLIADYCYRTTGVIVRHRGKEYGVIGMFSCTGLFATHERRLLNPSECTVLKTTLAEIANDTQYVQTIIKRNTGFKHSTEILSSHINHGYRPTINGHHWHDIAILKACEDLKVPVFRNGVYTCAEHWHIAAV